MKILCAYVGRGEHRCFSGGALVGTIHEVNGYYVPEVVISKGHVRFGKWMKSLAAARAYIAIVVRGEKL